jgi:hypothetical protein
MTSFYVSLDALGELAGRLQSLSGELRDAKGNTPGYVGQTGSDRVGGALDGFFADWSDGMSTVDSNLDGLADKLSKSANAYSAVECTLTQDMAAGELR